MNVFFNIVISIVVFMAAQLVVADELVILSPHRKSIQTEFVPGFKEYYKKTYGKEVRVDWLDQGGTSDDVRFLRARAAKNPDNIGIDIFWGGGSATFLDLSRDKLLSSVELPASLKGKVPPSVAGVRLRGTDNDWYATAMSSFGIMFNKKLLKWEKLAEPKSWLDLVDPKYSKLITLADPRRSGSAAAMNAIILEAYGWERGWQVLTAIAGNTKRFTHSSSDPIKAVVSGDAAVAMAIDFYALAKVVDLGTDKIGFVLPPEQTVLDPDPIGIVKGTKNRLVATRFLEYVLSEQPQKRLVLSTKEKDGPKNYTLGRLAVNLDVYKSTEGRRINPFNPFNAKKMLKLDADKAAKMRRPLIDLVGAILIDTHSELRKAWSKSIKAKTTTDKLMATYGVVPVTEAELLSYSDKWDDSVFRNKKINEWVEFAKKKYQKLNAGS